jgi:threonylcarbamoyladenosine tRNA methylthiotransferase MtaB
MARFAITTLGCKVNQYESAGITEALIRHGHSPVPFNDTADIYVVNTCTVTGKTDYQSRQLIRRAHRTNPAASIIVTGCYAQTAPEKLAGLPGVTMVVGTEGKEDIPYLINNILTTTPEVIVRKISDIIDFSGLCPTSFPGHTRAYLKIQDGCNAFCSYCIIPYARGRSRSLPEEDVLQRVSKLCAAGYREIILSGIHLGIYGHDLTPGSNLLALLRKIEDQGKIERLRISSIEPMEVTDDLIDYIKNSEIICRHLHIPLQSGDNSVLKLMKRIYNRDQFRKRIEKILDSIPGIAVGIDVMVGFPGEGDDEFHATKELIENMGVAYLHVFPYSPRPGTEALGLAEKVSESVKKERGKILRAIGRKKRFDFNSRFVGERLFVLIEETRDRATGLMKGFSDNYVPVLLTDGDDSLANKIVDITADRLRGGKVLGRKTQTF